MRKHFLLPYRRRVPALLGALLVASLTQAQPTFPVNGIADDKPTTYAFTNATIVAQSGSTLSAATMVVKDGKILALGTNITVPREAMVVDCKGKYIYPSFIDMYADYGMPPLAAVQRRFNFGAPAQLTSNQKGAYGWNQAIRSDVQAVTQFSADEEKAKLLRDQGFGTVLTHVKDGIARGTGAIVTLADDKENKTVLKEKASAHYSFSKGSSTQTYPSSLMGTIALLRQSYLDAQWYKNNAAKEGLNLSLQAWNDNLSLPQIFEANDKWMAVRADKIGDEFGVQYIIKAGGNEYQRIQDMAASKAAFILSLNYPQAMDVEDPNDARFISLADMKHWEMAPANAAAFEKAAIPFALTTADLRDVKQFLGSLRKAMEYGLSENKALDALTKTPASLLGIYNQVGSLEPGKLANFIVTNGPVFAEKTVILQNWVQGKKYGVKEENWTTATGEYQLALVGGKGTQNYTLLVKQGGAASVIQKDTLTGKLSYDGKMIKLSFPETKQSKKTIRLSGVSHTDGWQGTGEDAAGEKIYWTAKLVKEIPAVDSAKTKSVPQLAAVPYPFNGYGFETMPVQQTLLIRNATIWTNEKEGKIEGADLLIKAGKIAAVGKGLSDAGAIVVDGTGKHLTAGIIDEHSHIAAASINEGGQSVTSEVRIADNLNPDDINIYRQLSGGVTSSHILHGSANTIGGQTQLIKLRWGANAEGLKFANWTPQIKFALGENVKRSSSSANNRFPDSRMGVEEVLTDAFTRARDYEKAIQEASVVPKGKKAAAANPWATVRRDLELDALVEILNKKRFITCHSYVQSEITAAIRVGDKFGFTFNTFTHILEGYKVADKMKAHGSNASTFSDWWNYKMEVVDAIPQNAAIMHAMGLNVAINSDDAEMARRLNQEAAKSVKYGGMSEEDALKMVTLNPATMLHVEDRVGSIKVGKDADLVLWTDHPLSIYAKAEKTIVDGIVYFDRQKDQEMRAGITAERNRLIQKMIGEKKSGMPTSPARASMEIMHTCSDHAHSHGLLVVDADEISVNQ
ncbi:amidohydrolase family protein [Flavihumibacter sp. CACIAM 22H1]|uniref:amidohydrolase family protein n=1 Tax=Flavihumibacter sp. CACIAM 22H1 TaxID=1812911 RepID=UPI0007A86383|nr:amidohydrolase family protein [Flavihumibacter sp. CACIAM 22H1]KYP15005.1 MAG: amidohydrolase [Flavihumibacter sp. CACIAM 22H1]